MAMARGPLTPRLTTATPDTDMVDTMARGPLTPRLTTATPDTDMVDTMARGQLMPRLTTATPDTDMADTLTASKMLTSRDSKHPPSQCNTPISKSRHPSQNLYPKVPRRTDVIGEFCNLLHETKKNIF